MDLDIPAYENLEVEEKEEVSEYCGKVNKCCCSFSIWFLQILLWISLGLFIYFVLIKKETHIFGYEHAIAIFGGMFFLLWVTYFYIEVCFFALPNIFYEYDKEENADTIKRRLDNIFFGRPSISIFAGFASKTETTAFRYSSARDVSGLLSLDLDNYRKQGKTYLYLKLSLEVNAVDKFTCLSYILAKNQVYERSNSKNLIKIKELMSIPEMPRGILIKLRKCRPSISPCRHFIYTFLMFGEFFKLYAKSSYAVKMLKIRKIISNRYNLNENPYITQYLRFVPRLWINDKSYRYQPEEVGFYDETFPIKPLKKEDIVFAELNEGTIRSHQVKIDISPPPEISDKKIIRSRFFLDPDLEIITTYKISRPRRNEMSLFPLEDERLDLKSSYLIDELN